MNVRFRVRVRSLLAPMATLAVLGMTLVASSAPDNPDDAPDRDERLAAGRIAFRDNCLMCHGEEMTTGSRLSEKQWATEVDKMIGWGAPVPADLKGPLYEFLVSEYSTSAPAPAPPVRMSLAEALVPLRPQDSPTTRDRGDLDQGASLYARHCATCHGPGARGGDLGTCLVEKPVLLRPAEYDDVVRKGRRRMPGFAAALPPDQDREILAWLRTLRSVPPAP